MRFRSGKRSRPSYQMVQSNVPPSSSNSRSTQSSSRHNYHHPRTSKKGDKNILRGAEIIRQQIRQLQDEKVNAETIKDLILGREPNTKIVDENCAFTGDEFSDPWPEDGREEKRKSLCEIQQKPYEEFDFTKDSLMHINTTFASFPTQGDTTDWANTTSANTASANITSVHVKDYDQTMPKTLHQSGREAPPQSSSYYHDELHNRKKVFDAYRIDEDYSFDRDDYGDEDCEFAPSPSYLPKSLQDLPSIERDEFEQLKSDSRLLPKETVHLLPKISVKVNKSCSQSSTASPASVILSLSESDRSSDPDHYSKRPNPLPSPLTVEYKMLLADPAYLHAQDSGMLWQSLVGQQLRFPSHWYNGSRSPAMGGVEHECIWQYHGSCQVRWNSRLNQFVKNRAAPGRLLLHIIVQDLMNCTTIQDIAVGCFHPNARGIRPTSKSEAMLDQFREVWIAVRKHEPELISVIDSLLVGNDNMRRSPLGKKRVTNDNVRVVYGNQPPVQTVFIPENELYESLANLAAELPEWNAPMALLQEFVFI